MASTVLVREVLYRAGVLLQDIAPQFHRFPERDQVDLFNDAQLAITKFLPAACSIIAAIKLKPGTRQSIEKILAAECKFFDGTSPAADLFGTQIIEFIRNMGADGLTPGKSIRITEREILDSQSPDWHTYTGTSVRQFTFNPLVPRSAYVTPGVTGTMWAEVAMTVQPTKAPQTVTPGTNRYLIDGSDATVISVNDEHVDDLVNYIVARANMKDLKWADAGKGAAFAQMFLTSLNAKVVALGGANPNLSQLPFAPDPLGRAK
jgi:hypothetical protein